MTTTHKPEEVAAMLQIERRAVLRRAGSGEFPHLRIGKQVRFTDQHIAAIIAAHEVATAAEPSNPWGRVTRRRAS